MLLSKMFGVERGNPFEVKGYKGKEFRINAFVSGVEYLEIRNIGGIWDLCQVGVMCNIIAAAPAGIIHLPPSLTDEQREQLKALYTLGYRWLAKDRNNNVYAYGNIKTIKEFDGWGTSSGEFARIHEWMPEGVVASLVSWSDPEPYDIGKALGVGK